MATREEEQELKDFEDKVKKIVISPIVSVAIFPADFVAHKAVPYIASKAYYKAKEALLGDGGSSTGDGKSPERTVTIVNKQKEEQKKKDDQKKKDNQTKKANSSDKPKDNSHKKDMPPENKNVQTPTQTITQQQKANNDTAKNNNDKAPEKVNNHTPIQPKQPSQPNRQNQSNQTNRPNQPNRPNQMQNSPANQFANKSANQPPARQFKTNSQVKLSNTMRTAMASDNKSHDNPPKSPSKPPNLKKASAKTIASKKLDSNSRPGTRIEGKSSTRVTSSDLKQRNRIKASRKTSVNNLKLSKDSDGKSGKSGKSGSSNLQKLSKTIPNIKKISRKGINGGRKVLTKGTEGGRKLLTKGAKESGKLLKKGAKGSGKLLKKGVKGSGKLLKKGAKGSGKLLKKGAKGSGKLLKKSGVKAGKELLQTGKNVIKGKLESVKDALDFGDSQETKNNPAAKVAKRLAVMAAVKSATIAVKTVQLVVQLVLKIMQLIFKLILKIIKMIIKQLIASAIPIIGQIFTIITVVTTVLTAAEMMTYFIDFEGEAAEAINYELAPEDIDKKINNMKNEAPMTAEQEAVLRYYLQNVGKDQIDGKKLDDTSFLKMYADKIGYQNLTDTSLQDQFNQIKGECECVFDIKEIPPDRDPKKEFDVNVQMNDIIFFGNDANGVEHVAVADGSGNYFEVQKETGKLSNTPVQLQDSMNVRIYRPPSKENKEGGNG